MTTIKVTSSPHKIMTPRQVAEKTGKTEAYINQLTQRVNKHGETFLDSCYPFPFTDKQPNTGPKFILVNDKCNLFFKKQSIKL